MCIRDRAITVGGKELIEVTVNTGPATISVEVKDNGSGVAPDVEARLFQPNFTTKSSGSGLGLAMVKNIIENAGGAIVYRPNPQGGAIFLLEFPRVE